MGLLEQMAADIAAAKKDIAAIKAAIAAMQAADKAGRFGGSDQRPAGSTTEKQSGKEFSELAKDERISPSENDGKNPPSGQNEQKNPASEPIGGPAAPAAREDTPRAELGPNSISVADIDKRLRKYLADKPEEGMAACRAKIKKWELTPIRNIRDQSQIDAWGVFLTEKGY